MVATPRPAVNALNAQSPALLAIPISLPVCSYGPLFPDLFPRLVIFVSAQCHPEDSRRFWSSVEFVGITGSQRLTSEPGVLSNIYDRDIILFAETV